MTFDGTWFGSCNTASFHSVGRHGRRSGKLSVVVVGDWLGGDALRVLDVVTSGALAGLGHAHAFFGADVLDALYYFELVP